LKMSFRDDNSEHGDNDEFENDGFNSLNMENSALRAEMKSAINEREMLKNYIKSLHGLKPSDSFPIEFLLPTSSTSSNEIHQEQYHNEDQGQEAIPNSSSQASACKDAPRPLPSLLSSQLRSSLAPPLPSLPPPLPSSLPPPLPPPLPSSLPSLLPSLLLPPPPPPPPPMSSSLPPLQRPFSAPPALQSLWESRRPIMSLANQNVRATSHQSHQLTTRPKRWARGSRNGYKRGGRRGGGGLNKK
ncbi:hypothetical protein PV325_011942, partial [Microctonus aethiopoides]